MKYLFLALAIIFEVIGTSFLNKSEGFTKLVPTLITIVAFGVCFFFLSQALKEIPLGIVYAIWSGVGLVLTALISYFIFKQKLDLPAFIGIGLILVGVVVMNVFSKSTGH
ncbi:DMT family transporter [Capnocytophaga catalasegens]|uniref:Multidrug transporter n=1 Tax=Capnocytophaga catalasegens TaxID=1004260 RepID=A0AAV5AYD6_9FLAO|nr:SMR family transporter [Capnocytophaga catalasegens]GIZ16522.1 multidrug transporter [Capnocytophaga catalasegens]GJM51450.1 multidrug transporter [Capnocytophaga catalasegens]GJM53188.1 multidrug transporter [Capnocytophaga catalasegens]